MQSSAVKVQEWGVVGGCIRMQSDEEEYTEVEAALVIWRGKQATVQISRSFQRGAKHGRHGWVNQSHVNAFGAVLGTNNLGQTFGPRLAQQLTCNTKETIWMRAGRISQRFHKASVVCKSARLPTLPSRGRRVTLNQKKEFQYYTDVGHLYVEDSNMGFRL